MRSYSLASAEIVEPGAACDWICIGPSAWASAVLPLMGFWGARGHQVGFKSLETLAVSHGTVLGEVLYDYRIKPYLDSLYVAGAGTLRYVLLLGDADASAPFGLGGNIIPSHYTYNPTLGGWSEWVPSDWWYVDFNDDRQPECAVGRAPVRTAAEVVQFVDKALRAAAQKTASVPVDHVGLWAYAQDNGVRYGARVRSNATILSESIPERIQVRYLRDDMLSPQTSVGRKELARTSFEEGRSIVAIMSTGTSYSNWQWVSSGTFSWSSTAPNWRLHPFMLGLSCDLADVDRREDAGRPLLETGLLAIGRGPWGAFGPSRTSPMDVSRRIGADFFQRVLGSMTLCIPGGEAARQTVGAFANDENGWEAAWSHMYIGDPLVPISNGVVATDPSVAIAGPELVVPGQLATWSAVVAGGDGIYALRWFKLASGASAWQEVGSGQTCSAVGGDQRIGIRCVVTSGGRSAQADLCVAPSSMPSIPGLNVAGPLNVEPGSSAQWTATVLTRDCQPYVYEWRTRAPYQGPTSNQYPWSAIVSGEPGLFLEDMPAGGIDLLVIARAGEGVLSQVVEVRPPAGNDGGGSGCPTVDVRTTNGWATENTILGRAPSGALMLDSYRMKNRPDTVGGVIRVRIRESEEDITTLDEVRLVAIDHSAGTRAYGVGNTVLLGIPIAATKVLLSTGEDLTSLLNGSGAGYLGSAGDTLVVDLVGGQPPVSFAQAFGGSARLGGGEGGGDFVDDGGGKGAQQLGADVNAPMLRALDSPDEAVLNTSGIIVQAPSADGGWETIRHYYPRQNPDGALLDTVGYSQLRLIFVGSHSIRSVGRLVQTDEVFAAAKLPLLGAGHSRLGDVTRAVSALGNLMTTIAPGDTLDLVYGMTPAAPGTIRDLFLFTNGVYTSNLPAKARPPGEEVPGRFELHQNRPNPFARSTTIRFDLPAAARVNLEVFDLQGRLVRGLAKGLFSAGRYSLEWDHQSDSSSPVPPGIYLYRLMAGEFVAKRKMLLLP